MVTSDIEALFWGVVTVLGGVAALYYAGLQFRDWWSLRGTDADGLHVAAGGGPVALEGSARPVGDALAAPFTGRDCVAHEVEIEEYRFDDDGSNWHTVHTATAAEPFLLSTTGGEALVAADADGFDVDVADEERRLESDDGDPPPERVRAYVAEADVDPATGWSLDTPLGELSGGDRRRYTERILAVGETAAVSGEARAPANVDRDVPRTASAVVLPGDDRPGGRPSMVADASLAATTGRELKRGLGGLALAAVLLAVGALFLLS